MNQAQELLALMELTPPKGHDKPCAVCDRCYWHCECEAGHRPPVTSLNQVRMDGPQR